MLFNTFSISASNGDVNWAKLSTEIREKREWNQEELAIELGLHGSTVAKIEQGRAKPSRKTRKRYKKLAEQMGLSIEKFAL